MRIVHNPDHHRHQGRLEMFRGRLVPCHETPARVDHVLAELGRRPQGPVVLPDDAGLDALLARVHAPRYLAFLGRAWDDWVALDPANAALDAIPSVWPVRGFRADLEPDNFAARLGLYSFDAGTPLTAGSWAAARAGAACALTAARAVTGGGERQAFALTRPPGHHAGADFFGGYCFLNNAAVAAQALREAGAARVAVLDIDYHHGNGTQSLFYERADVFTASIHGDPRTEYPFYLGHADERGAGPGLGHNLNLPLPRGTGWAGWAAALDAALAALGTFGADACVVSLGVDTYAGDPISGFTLDSADYTEIGRRIAAALGGRPCVWVYEGGYAVDAVGVNVVNVLEGANAAGG
ncbi:histone deacetylase family protein [Piscinibacter sakaiensis]|uniref:Deacetylase n=1 Tax=Piscinibacter sakaiensis TaxID=1547922 RepID=A0A0K8P6M8_PISS1|nr:histone deacetylase family protein [Piscinibacter sakaiensis]GAP38266.1 deacetylase [Piscinibacter sakaiensis]